MKLLIKDSDVKIYKHLVGLASSSVDKSGSNLVEATIQLHADIDVLYISALDSNNHYVRFSCPASIHIEGVVHISAIALMDMTKKVGNTSLSISLESNKLVYTVPVLGSISEPIMHAHNAYKASNVCRGIEEDSELVLENSSILPIMLKAISNVASKNRPIRINTSKTHIDIYGLGNEGGPIRYRDVMDCYKEVDLTMDLGSVRLVTSLSNCLSISINKTSDIITFTSDIGIIRCRCVKQGVGEYLSMESVLKQVTAGLVEVSLSDIESAVKWQSYKADTGQVINLVPTKDGLGINVASGNLDKPSIINVTSVETGMRGMTLNLNALDVAIKAIKGNGKGDRLSLDQKVIKVGDREVKILSIYPCDKANGYGVVNLNEHK
jgi:hypothetical protein